MASYASTSTFLRTSVFDAAFEIGLADPKLAAWLEEEPQPQEKKPHRPAAFESGPEYPLSTGPNQWIPPSDSQPEKARRPNGPGNYPFSTRQPQWSPSTDSEVSTSSLPTLTTIPSISSVSSHGGALPASKSKDFEYPSRSRAFKTLGLPAGSTFEDDDDAKPVFYTPPLANSIPSTPHPKAPKQPMKLLKGRSSTKKPTLLEKANRTKPSLDSGTDVERGRFAFLSREPSPPPDAKDKDAGKGFFGRLRDRSRSKSKARKAKDGPRSRLSEEDAAPEPEDTTNDPRGRDQTQKHVHMATVKVVMTDGAPQLLLESSRKSTDLLTSFGSQFGTPLSTDPSPAPPVSKPIPRNRPIMDRSYTRARTSGLWANKERGLTGSRGGGARTGGVARKGSATRKASVRMSGAGLRRAPSARRRMGVRSRSNSIGSQAAFKEVAEEPEPAEPATSEEQHGSDDRDWRSIEVEAGDSVVASVPVIIERRPSDASTWSSSRPRPHRLITDAPSPNGSIRTFLPRSPSPNRLSTTRFSRNIPSPTRPPTSPLPPTPNVLTPENDAVIRESNWFDDGSSQGSPRRPTSRASTGLAPTEAYIVPTPSSFVTAFHGEAAPTAPVEARYGLGVRRMSSERHLPPMKPLPAGASMRPRTASDAQPIPPPLGGTQKLNVKDKAAPSAWAGVAPVAGLSLRPPSIGLRSAPGSMPVSPSSGRNSPAPPPEIPLPISSTNSPQNTHSRLPSTSSASGTQQQRGRASPFPTRPVPSLSRSNSVISQRAATPSGRPPIPVDVESTGRRSSESFRTASDDGSVHSQHSLGGELSPTTGFLKRKPSVVSPVKPVNVQRYNQMPLGAFLPAAKKGDFDSREVYLSRSPSPPVQPLRDNLPPMPRLSALQRAASGRTPPQQAPPLLPVVRPSLNANVRPSSFQPEGSPVVVRPSTIVRQDTFPPRNSVYTLKGKSKKRESTWTKSIYSTGEGDDSDYEDRFDLELDDEDSKGFDVIAKMIGGGPIAESSRPTQLTVPVPRPSPPRGSATILTVPIRPLSPSPSPRARPAAGAGGAKWI